MQVFIHETYEQLSSFAAQEIKQLLNSKPNAVLGLATGSTPLALYQELVRMHRDEGLDFSQVTTFNLDEYVGLPKTSEQSYHYFMHENFFQHVNIPKQNIYIPLGNTDNSDAFCDWYESRIKECGGIDLQILGIGSDGHIAFNEPTSSLGSRTRIKTLAPQTVADNARFFDSPDEVPRQAITMGVGTILESRKVVLLAAGANKADAMAKTIEGPVTSMITASALQMHRDVRCYLDKAAASELTMTEYYDWIATATSRNGHSLNPPHFKRQNATPSVDS